MNFLFLEPTENLARIHASLEEIDYGGDYWQPIRIDFDKEEGNEKLVFHLNSAGLGEHWRFELTFINIWHLNIDRYLSIPFFIKKVSLEMIIDFFPESQISKLRNDIEHENINIFGLFECQSGEFIKQFIIAEKITGIWIADSQSAKAFVAEYNKVNPKKSIDTPG